MSSKTVLIVYAHYADTSFNAALLNTARTVLEKSGHNVIVSDLYKSEFNPVMGQSDIIGRVQQEGHFEYESESGTAWEEGRLASDIVGQQKLLDAADLVIFQFPLQWMSWPAVLKGWLERVFINKYAYSHAEGNVMDRAHLKGKKAVLSFTTGGGPGYFSNTGISGQMDVATWPMHVALRFVGLDILKPQVSFGPGLRDQAGREQMLEDWGCRLQTIFDESPLFFFPLSAFEPQDGYPGKGMVLKAENTKNGLRTVGQNMGKPLPTSHCLSDSVNGHTNSSNDIEGVD